MTPVRVVLLRPRNPQTVVDAARRPDSVEDPIEATGVDRLPLDRFVALPDHGRTRRYVARRPEDLFPNNPGFASPVTATEIQPGYWLMVHASHQMLESIAKLACEVAGVRYGKTVQLRLK